MKIKSQKKIVKILGFEVVEGSKRHQVLVQQKKQFDDLAANETCFMPTK